MSDYYEEKDGELDEREEHPIEYSVIEIETPFGLVDNDAGTRLLTAMLNFITSCNNMTRRR
jgi:hypothetical protein